MCRSIKHLGHIFMTLTTICCLVLSSYPRSASAASVEQISPTNQIFLPALIGGETTVQVIEPESPGNESDEAEPCISNLHRALLERGTDEADIAAQLADSLSSKVESAYWQNQAMARKSQVRTTGWRKFESYAVNKEADLLELPTFRQMVNARRDPERLIVKLANCAAPLNALDELGLTYLEKLGDDNVYLYSISATVEFDNLLDRTNAHPSVIYAEPDYLVELNGIPDDPGTGTGVGGAWWLNQINAFDAWDHSTDATGIGPIAVFDSGILATHDDLLGNMWVNTAEVAGNDVDDDGNGYPDDIYGPELGNGDRDHGTNVAGTICAKGNNGLGYVGAAWSCQLMDIRGGNVFNQTISDAILALEYAVENGARLSNHSWSVTSYSQALADAVNAAEAADHLMIVAAGNNGYNLDASARYPASLPNPNIIAVAATTENDAKVNFSNFGPQSVDLAAPAGFFTTAEDGGYESFNGTSQSVALVTGATALAWSQVPTWQYYEIRQHILDNVRPSDLWLGLTSTGGILNMEAVMSGLSPDTDADGLPDVDDPDDDNDGVADTNDAFPRDGSETNDADNDRIGDNTDTDDDNDGVNDIDDWAPTNPAEQYDTDGDGIGNNADTDDDGDGTPDANDALPLDAGETEDSDGDGVGDNSDLLPNDPSESLDSDSDGTGDNADLDADNDGIPDATEAYNNTNITNWENATTAVNIVENAISFTPYATTPGYFDQVNSEKFSALNIDNDYRVSWTVASIPNASFSAVGLGITDRGSGLEDLDYGLLNGNGTLYIYESGTEVDSFGSVAVGTELAIEVTNNTLTYQKDGDILRTVDLNATPDFYLDIAFNSYRGYTGASYMNFKIEPFGSVDPDVDNDGIVNALDLDSDNDAIPDVIEAGLVDSIGNMRVDNGNNAATIPNPPDTDNDGLPDYIDLESGNADNDGTDYDIATTEFARFDTNRDGMINERDASGGDDNDGNGVDALIDDTDKDGLFNYIDLDDDADGVPDETDAFPLDANETTDSDGDGVGDNGDAFPTDSGETTDTDGDGIGDNGDTDDDNDGILDTVEDEGGSLGPADLDEAVAELLDVSASAFENAADGQWVSITRGEYDAFVDSINGVERFGTSESSMATGPFANFGGGNTYSYGQNTNPSPANVNIFAFKYGSGNTVDGNNNRVRLSSNGSNGFQQHGNTLPTGQVIGNQQFFLLKGADNTIFSTPQYLGFTTNDSNPSYYNANDTSGRYSLGNTTNPSTFGFGWALQGLAIEGGQSVSAANVRLATEGDSDGDGILDRHDLDSDNDTIPDVIEAGLADDDKNYMVDEISLAGSVAEPADSDDDGLADYLDIESDNAENNGSAFDIDDGQFAGFDTNSDGRIDTLDAAGGGDLNANGIDDLLEDNDRDGINNIQDPDDDNDGVLDDQDAFPFDPNETVDSDGDGVGNNGDAFPNDAAETADSDGDGVGDNADAFPDNPAETTDTDGDGIGDNGDVFPEDPSESEDTDGDGIGNNADIDSDNDGLPDSVETAGGLLDSDSDGVYDLYDLDSDNDSIPDVIEAGLADTNRDLIVDELDAQGTITNAPNGDGDSLPDYRDLESSNAANDGTSYDIMTGDDAAFDTNGDGQINGQDTNGGSDENGNGVDDLLEDNDEDGINDIQDPDDDNDGVLDDVDAFPTDPDETVDSDGDGVGNNGDAFPNDPAETEDSDGDGVGDNSDDFPTDPSETTDTDNDGVGDNTDALPNDPNETEDSDNDGIGNNSDVDSDNDGITDVTELRTAFEITSWSNPQNGVTAESNEVAYDGSSSFRWNSQINSAPRSTYGYSDNYRFAWRLSGNLSSSNAMFGLGVDESAANYADIEYAFYNSGGTLAIFEAGFSTGVTIGTVDSDDVISIEVSNGQLTYRINGNAVRSVSIEGNPDFYIDTSFFSGALNLVDIAIEPVAGLSTDQDGDGVLNTLDQDSDNDTIPDLVEVGLTDSDGNFIVDDLDNDQASITNPRDSDSDGLPDYQDLESNNPANDGTAFDIRMGNFGQLDTNNDGMVDGNDAQGGTDEDGDGVDDSYDPEITDEPQGLLGDVSCDGFVNVVDALAIMQYTVGMRTATDVCPLTEPAASLNVAQGDVGGDSSLNAIDALYILQCEVGISNVFCPRVTLQNTLTN